MRLLVIALLLLGGCASIVGADFDRPAALEQGTPDAGACDDPCPGKCGQTLDGCGKIADCGGCPSGQSCGGAGPNVCGTGACTPSCTDKACGASDGCGGVCKGACPDAGPTCTPSCGGKACGASDGCGGSCNEGTCGAGLRCVKGACACDATSCSGCCSAGQCQAGTSLTACGSGGAACAVCKSSGQACTAGACAACSGKATDVSVKPSQGTTSTLVIDSDYGEMYAIGFTAQRASETIVALHMSLVNGGFADGTIYAEVHAGTPKNDGGSLGPRVALDWATVDTTDTPVTFSFSPPIVVGAPGTQVWIRLSTDSLYDDENSIVVDGSASQPPAGVTMWQASSGTWSAMTRNIIASVDVGFCP
jgi:hypothetical protein